MRRVAWAGLRLLGAAGVLGLLIWRVGTGPFLRGIETISGWSVVAIAAITVLTTICSAWRWQVIARRLGVALSLPDAIAAYYRSQFLNSALPGGVLGDVHRGVCHGRDTHEVGRALRAVAWERTAGQLVQATLAALVLLIAPSPVRGWMPWALGTAATAAAAIVLTARLAPQDGPSRFARAVRSIRRDWSTALTARAAWPAVVIASTIAVVGYTSMFLIAAKASGSTASPGRLLPLGMVVVLASALPLNVAGWGPREGVAAWAFGAAGLGTGAGVAAAAAYGVLCFVATVPGAVVLIVSWLRRRRSLPTRPSAAPAVSPAVGMARPRPSTLVRAVHG